MDFNVDQIVESAVNRASSPISLNLKLTNLTPSIESSPSIKLKVLPKHLNYVYLGEQKTLPIIITSHLTIRHEESLMSILRKHKEATDWTMTDIKGLTPAILQHRIHLNEEATPKRDSQRRLNPIMQKTVHAEILKLLKKGINYPIFDSQWVSLVHAVPN